MKSSYFSRNGSGRRRIFHKNDGAQAQLRRTKALQRLQKQLEKGVKHNNGVDTLLEETDIQRIQKELQILKTKLS